LATVVAGPFAILGAFMGAGGTASLAIILVVATFGPLAEEMLKASLSGRTEAMAGSGQLGASAHHAGSGPCVRSD
jgi:hypothetical protein